MADRRCILIYGSGRSGTSAVAGTLHHLGVALGTKIIPATPANKKGYFENLTAVDINETLLKHLQIQYNLDFLPPGQWWEKEWTEIFRYAIRGFIQEEFAGKELFMIKDPRLSLLLPLWLRVLDELNIRHFHVITFRNPVEVSRSLHVSNAVNEKAGLLRWLNTYFLGEYYSRGQQRMWIPYESFLDSPASTIRDLVRNFSLGEFIEVRDEVVEKFISPELRNQKYESQIDPDRYPVPVSELHGLLAGDHLEDQEGQNRIDRVRERYMNQSGFFYHDAYREELFAYNNRVRSNPPHYATFYISIGKVNRYVSLPIHIWKNYWILRSEDFGVNSFPSTLTCIPSDHQDTYEIEEISIPNSEGHAKILSCKRRNRYRIKIGIEESGISKIYFFVKYKAFSNRPVPRGRKERIKAILGLSYDS